MTCTPTEGGMIVLVGTGAYAFADDFGPGVVARSVAQWCADQGGAQRWRVAIVYRSTAGRERAEAGWKQIRAEIPAAPEATLMGLDGEAAEAAIEAAHALFVCVPDSAHAEWIERGIAARVPTWVVKPFTGDGRTSAELAERAARADVPVWVDYHKRFDVSNRLIRTSLETGEHGAPLLFQIRYSQPRSLPLEGFAWTAETNVFSYIGCHYVDQLFYWMPGLELEGVDAHGVRGPVFERIGRAGFDTVLARLTGRFRGRPVTAQLEVGWSNPKASPTKSLQIVEVACERGRLFMDQTRRGVELWSDDRVTVPNPYFFGRLHDPLAATTRYQGYGWESVRAFLDFTLASEAERRCLRANDALPWAAAGARVDAVLDRVAEALVERD